MRKWGVLIAVVVLCIAGWLVFHVSSEPAYNGQPLSVWLRDYYLSFKKPGISHPPFPKDGEEALSHVGTNWIPTLLNMLQADNSELKYQLLNVAKRQHFIPVKFIAPEERNFAAIHGFELLGGSASNAVPSIIRIFEQKRSMESQIAAAEALGAIGPAAKDAVPVLLVAATNRVPGIQAEAILNLGRIHSQPDLVIPVLSRALDNPWVSQLPDGSKIVAAAIAAYGHSAQEALPVLIGLLKSPDAGDRAEAAFAIGRVASGTNVGPTTSALVDLAKDPVAKVRQYAASSLGEIGAGSGAAIHILLELLNDADGGVRRSAVYAIAKVPDAEKNGALVSGVLESLKDSDTSVRMAAAYTLKKIAPEATAKAVVK